LCDLARGTTIKIYRIYKDRVRIPPNNGLPDISRNIADIDSWDIACRVSQE
jgi:hypothetical protein